MILIISFDKIPKFEDVFDLFKFSYDQMIVIIWKQ